MFYSIIKPKKSVSIVKSVGEEFFKRLNQNHKGAQEN